MRWSPGPISPNIEDRRFEDPEAKLAQAMNAARAGDIGGWQELPPWMWPDDVQLQQAAVQRALDRLAGAP
jgi:hypothetical protein